MTKQTDREALLAYFFRALNLLPSVPDSMSRTLHDSCKKTVRRLVANDWITKGEAAHLSARVRDAMHNRQPSRCGFERKET